MNKGLITRIGEWMDNKWAAKATWLDVQEQENRCSSRHCGALEAIAEVKGDLVHRSNELNEKHNQDIFSLRKAITDLTVVTQAPSEVAKELAALKARLEQLEIYTNMSRKVDPTKATVVKSAFAM